MTDVEPGSAALRALSGVRNAYWRAALAYRGQRPVPMPVAHLRVRPDAGEIPRGVVDGVAMRLRYSDEPTLRQIRPEQPLARAIVDQLEQFRVESLAPLPGIAANLRHRFAEWAWEARAAGHLDTEAGLLLYGLAQMVRSRLTGEPVLAETEDLIEPVRARLAPLIGTELAGLRANRHDQLAYARHALAIAELLAEWLPIPDERERERDESSAASAALLVFEDDGTAGAHGETEQRGGLAESSGGYRVFSTAYDRQQHSTELIRAARLRESRERLDELVARQRVPLGRLCRELRAVLAEPSERAWRGGQEEGYVDAGALAQLISSPAERRLFRVEQYEPSTETVLRFLIDCSGSMKRHAEAVAVLVDTFARAADRIGAGCEVLGFNTAAWHGGRVHKAWTRAGKPADPGRLNERRHLVFAEDGTPWRRARTGIAGLLSAELFTEGIDGEAVAWAHSRAARDPDRRHVLFVFSDGGPADRATLSANEPGFLDAHLRSVTSAIERSGAEVIGVGIGADLSSYYRRSVRIDPSAAGYASFATLLSALAG